MHSFAETELQVTVPVGDAQDAVDLFAYEELQVRADSAISLELKPYGHRWFRLRRPGQRLAP